MPCRLLADLSREVHGESISSSAFRASASAPFRTCCQTMPGHLSTEISKLSLQPWLVTNDFAEFPLSTLNHETLFPKRSIKLGLPIPFLDELWRQLVRDGVNNELSEKWKEFPAMQRTTGGHVKSAELRMRTYQKVAVGRLFKPESYTSALSLHQVDQIRLLTSNIASLQTDDQPVGGRIPSSPAANSVQMTLIPPGTDHPPPS